MPLASCSLCSVGIHELEVELLTVEIGPCDLYLDAVPEVVLVVIIAGVLTGGSEICQTIAVNGAMGGIISTEMSISNLFDKIECKLFGCKSWEVSV